jgi:hypothetical protein
MLRAIITRVIAFADRFFLEHELGSGGMARVYLGRDEVLDRPVAIKVLNPVHGGTDIGNRFEREGRTAARLAHPNIVQVYDAGEALFDGRETFYIVMEYVPGGDLKGLIDERGRLSGHELAGLADEICAGLAHAHGRGVIHRDIKPHNILLDENGHAKVTDFGIARALDTTQATRTGSFLGTALYSSPEQLQGHKVTPKSDVYSLGATLYQAATGEPPFSGATPIEIASQHVSRTPVPPRRLGADMSEGLQALILDCLAKHPDDRPTSEEVRSRLEAEIPIAAQPQPPTPVAAPTRTEQTRTEPVTPPPGARSGGEIRREGRGRWGRLLAVLVILAVLAVLGALAAPNLFGGEGSQGAGSNNSGRNNARVGGNEGRSGGQPGGGPGSDQGLQGSGGGASPSPAATASAAASASAASSASAQASPGGRQSAPQRAAEDALQKVYTTAANGDYDASYGVLSEHFKATKAQTEAKWANTFTGLQSIRFVEGPDAEVSGNVATVTGVTIARKSGQTERNTVTWRMVNEGGGWKMDDITSFDQEIISG